MAVTPDTTISLLKVPIEIDEKNQITFSTATAQYNYFNGCTKKTEDDLFYQRKDNYIAWPDHIDNIIEYNYVMYQNTNYTNKWFYAFITRMEYENDGMTRVYIETDVYQTWMFDITYKASFVEREHVNDDTVGKNIVEENLNIGDVICEVNENIAIDQTICIAVATTWLLTEVKIEAATAQYPWGHYTASGQTSPKVVNNILGNIIGNDLIFFPLTSDGLKYLKAFISGTNAADHIQDISNIYIVPLVEDNNHSITGTGFRFYDSYSDPQHIVDTTYYYYRYTESNTPIIQEDKTLTISLDSFSDYTPKNNKVKCYPYNYLYISNNIGNHNILKIEDFADSTSIKFDYEFTCSVGGSARLIPKNYKGVPRNLEESMTLAKYPTCSWSSDAFISWLTENAINIPTKALSIASNLPSIEKGGLLSSTALNVAGFIGQFYEASLLPKMENGQSTADINYTAGDNDFNVYRMRAKTPYLKTIDNYFNMFGYKVNEVKVPNITGRTYWNFVKTVDCNITGNIPQLDLQKIKDMFNTGVTLWHNTSYFLDYTQNNAIVTPST